MFLGLSRFRDALPSFPRISRDLSSDGKKAKLKGTNQSSKLGVVKSIICFCNLPVWGVSEFIKLPLFVLILH